MNDRALRAVGFLLLMIGLGLRLDTRWQGLAWLFVLTGFVAACSGLWVLATRPRCDAFVAPPGQG